MQTFIEILKSILFGIVEGVTEWLPISSTGHMIILDEFVKLNVREEFWNLFLVVIQLGAILAVVVLFWEKIWPFGLTANAARAKRGRRDDAGEYQRRGSKEEADIIPLGGICIKTDILILWIKILIACLPAAVIGLLFDDWIDEHLYNFPCVAGALIIFGILFIIIEKRNEGKKPRVRSVARLDYLTVVLIGVFQVLAAVFPGTSRSGATIIGALLLGVARPVAAEFTFYLAIPVMFGASLLKVLKFVKAGLSFTGMEGVILLVGCVVAYVVSVLVIKFLMEYIKKHNFIPFGIYRIALGLLLFLYFFIIH
ncbi:MAG: undecaprenyl-diphosphate phosphatase [Lachnospiraceae bacterium]|nr:undecaprenyl-diphosphate phosphatase [Lachnospiraceae bacterium]